MMRKFVHKTLGWIAEQGKETDYQGNLLYCVLQEFTNDDNNNKYTIKHAGGYKYNEKELIALGFDEVIEKDWIDDAWKEYDECWTTNRYEEFREIIKKHAPMTNLINHRS